MVRRKQLLVSDEVQHRLLFRVTAHWVLFVLAICLTVGVWITCIDLPLGTWAERQAAFLRVCIPLLVCSLIVVPVFVYDVAKLSNQFAGPITRIRQGLAGYFESGKADPIVLRRNDYWQALATDFNRLVGQHESNAAAATKQVFSED